MSGRTDSAINYVGIFGRRLSGKTTLTIAVCADSFRREGRLSVVLDPKKSEHNWGAHCWVTDNRDAWLAKWQSPACRNCNIVWEETSTTLKRDTDYVDVFTMKAGAHGHRLIITGHTGKSLLPEMREQITEVFLFRQSTREAEMWCELFADDRLMKSTELVVSTRQFLHAKFGGSVEIQRLSL